MNTNPVDESLSLLALGLLMAGGTVFVGLVLFALYAAFLRRLDAEDDYYAPKHTPKPQLRRKRRVGAHRSH